VSLTKLANTLYYYDVHVDGDSPKEPVEPDSKETNQSLDNNQDVPSSISKEKKASEQV